MLNFIKNFRNDEDGAVTVDWVVLTAAIVALGLAVGGSVATNTKTVSSGTAAAILTADD
jgi:Flp pilus assembly pilin Flp